MRLDLSDRWRKILSIILGIFVALFALRVFGFLLRIVFNPFVLILLIGAGVYFYKKNKRLY